SGVAVHDLDVLDRQPELAGDYLRESRLMALAVAVRAREHGDRAGRVHPPLAPLEKPGSSAQRTGDVRGREPAGFDVARVAESAQHAALCRLLLAGGEAGDVGEFQRAVERGRVVAGVVGETHGRRVRKLGDEVAPSKID